MNAKQYTYKKTPQGELKIHVHFPPGWQESDARPAVVFFFGGGWLSGSVQQFVPQADYLAGRGMVAARADYRVKQRHEATPDECVEDAKSAVRSIRANAASLGVDPNRIVGSGGSAGAHIAACAATTVGLEAAGEDTTVSSRPDALVLFNPALEVYGKAERMERLAGKGEALAKMISPVLNVTAETPPALLLYGTDDRMLAEGKAFVAEASKLGCRAELYLAEGVGHAFFNNPPWLQRTIHRMDEFLASLGYVAGPPTIELPVAAE